MFDGAGDISEDERASDGVPIPGGGGGARSVASRMEVRASGSGTRVSSQGLGTEVARVSTTSLGTTRSSRGASGGYSACPLACVWVFRVVWAQNQDFCVCA